MFRNEQTETPHELHEKKYLGGLNDIHSISY